MHKISDKDKRLWNFYVSNLKSIKKPEKKIEFNYLSVSVSSKVLKPNISFSLDSKTKKSINTKKSFLML